MYQRSKYWYYSDSTYVNTRTVLPQYVQYYILFVARQRQNFLQLIVPRGMIWGMVPTTIVFFGYAEVELSIIIGALQLC